MRSRITIGLVAAALALTACGPTSSTGSAGQPQRNGDAPVEATADKPANSLGSAGDASRKAGTAKMAFTMEAETGGQKMVMGNGTGAIDFTANRYQFSQSINGEAGGSQPMMNVVMDNGVGYLQSAAGGEMGPWLKMDLTALLGKSGSTDMSAYLDLLQGVSESNEVGSETVRGVATTHYKVVVDPNKALEKSPEMREFLESLKQLGEKLAPGSGTDTALQPMPYDVWLDKAGLVQKMRSETEVTGDDGSKVIARSTVEYYDYGQPVDITIPQVN
jgi:hypothetical protein